MEALKLGFTSIMYDCSTADYDTNVKNVAQMTKICHAMGVTVEGKWGHVGDNAGAKIMMGLIPYEIEAMKEVVREKITLFGSVDKA